MLLAKFCLPLIMALSSAQAFLIDATTWEERKPGDAKVTPAMESAQRGKDEDYAQAVGQIQIDYGAYQTISTGTLIAPNIIVTASHCVANYNIAKSTSFSLTACGKTYSASIIAIEMPTSYLLSHLLGKQTEYTTDDIAIVRLSSSIELESYPTFDFTDMNEAIKNTIESGRVPKMMGVSCGTLTKNGDPTVTFSGRHLGVFQMRLSKIPASLVASPWIPVKYSPKKMQLMLGNKINVPEFHYDYQSTKTFLHATLRSGDSGSSLLTKVGNQYKIIGIAGGQIFGDAFDKKTGMFVPGKSYLDCWTAVHNYAEWIQESIAKLQKL